MGWKLTFYNNQKKLKSLKFKSLYDLLLEKFDAVSSLFKDDYSCELAGLNIVFVSLFYGVL